MSRTHSSDGGIVWSPGSLDDVAEKREKRENRHRDHTHDAVTPTPWWAGLILGALGGIASYLAFPPTNLWWLLPIGIALLSIAMLIRGLIAAIPGAFAYGLGFFIPLTEWASTYAGTQPWMALAAVQSLYLVLYALLTRTVLVRRGPGLLSALLIACLWVAVETLRSHVPWGGLPWGAAAFALSDSMLLNLGPWIGVAGLSFVVAFMAQLLAFGLLALAGRRRRGLTGIAGVWPIAAVLIAILACLVVPHPAHTVPEGRPSLRVAGIQGSMGPIDPVALTMPPEVFENNVKVTQEVTTTAQKQNRPLQLIVWPEDSTGASPLADPGRAQILGRLSEKAAAPVLVGTQRLVTNDAGDATGRYNIALLYGAAGEPLYEYAKRHPVPFGEFIPYRDFFRKLSPLVDMIAVDMLPGEKVGVMDLAALGEGAGKVGVLICFEIAYDDLVDDVVTDGAEVIVVQSNNALFGHSHEAIQQLAEAKVMAVVSGRSVVHVSTVGHSAIFTPEGRQLAFVDHWKQGAVVADVPLRTSITPAVAAGAWPAIGMCAIGALGWLICVSGPRRALARYGPRRRR